MVTAILFIQLIGDMTNECGNKRSVRLRREMDVLSAGRSGTSTVSAGKWPELLESMSLHSSPQGRRAGTLSLFWSFCHPLFPYLLLNEHRVTLMRPPTATATFTPQLSQAHLRDPEYLDVNQRENLNLCMRLLLSMAWGWDVARMSDECSELY